MKRTEVYLIRHAATAMNHGGYFQGSSDIPLNEAGQEQAEYLRKRFDGVEVDAIYVSNLVRTSQTIAPLAKAHGLEPIIYPGLEEIDGGLMEKRTHLENFRDYPIVMDHIMRDPYFVEMPQGESAREVYDRVVAAFLAICSENEGKTVIIVSHGFALQLLSSYLKGIAPEETKRLISANTGVTHLYVTGSEIEVDYLYDASHLPEKWQVSVENKNTDLYNKYRAEQLHRLETKQPLLDPTKPEDQDKFKSEFLK